MRADRFTDQVAVVTAGGSGIGFSTAHILASEGARLAIVDKDVAAGQKAAAELRGLGAEVMFVEADLSRPELIGGVAKQVIAHFGQVNILVNNAGSGRAGVTIVDQDWLFMKHLLPGTVERGSGAIVNVAALAGIRVAFPASPAYSAAKAAVVHLRRFAAIQYAPYGVRVNVVAPGLTATPAVMNALTEQQRAEIIRGLHAIPGIAEPSEVAATIAFLCSDKVPILTGLTVPVDGGWNAR